MKKLLLFVLMLLTTIIAQEKIELLRYDATDLASVKNRIQQKDNELLPSYQYLMNMADKAINNGPYSVMDKPMTPPSGDKHDYMSLSPYWWPDPEKEDGLPYIRRDGEVNPEREKFDKRPFANMCETVSILSFAYYFSDDKKYAERTAFLIKTWFLNEKTRMNPNLNFGQGVPGRADGRSVGIIEMKNLIEVMDAISLVQNSKYWREENQEAMNQWLTNFLDWLLTDEIGIEEGNRPNNHGSWYHATASYIAYYIGNKKLAKEILSDFAENKIATQVEPDGSQPHELVRTRAFSYSIFNIRAHLLAANLGEKLGLNILNYTAPNGGSIKKEIDFLIPYALDNKKWPYKQIRSWRGCYEDMFLLLRIGSHKFDNPEYETIINKIPEIDTKKSLINLVFPKKI